MLLKGLVVSYQNNLYDIIEKNIIEIMLLFAQIISDVRFVPQQSRSTPMIDQIKLGN